MVCAVALELGIEPDFVQEVIATRSLEAVRHDFGAWPWPVRVRTLGRFAVELEGRPLVFSGKVARKPIELLQFLIASGGTEVSAASAMFTLWRDLDGDKARSAFNVALHRLRKLLANNDAIQLELGRISLHPKAVWIDALAFEQLVDSALAPVPERLSDPAAASLHRAVGLYRGPFLGDDEDEPWQLVYRSRLASKFTRAVRQLTRHARANGDATQMRSLLERALEIDPSAEDTTRELMELLSDSGERASALAVFERCRLTMARLFDAQPASSTLELAERLRAAQ